MEGNHQRHTEIFSPILLRWGDRNGSKIGHASGFRDLTYALSHGRGTQPVRNKQLSMQVTI